MQRSYTGQVINMEYPIIDKINECALLNNWTGINVSKSKNLLHIHDMQDQKNGINVSVSNGVCTFSGTPTETTEFVLNIDPLIIPISINAGGNGCMYFFNNFSTTKLSLIFYNNDTKIDSWSFSPANKISSTYSGQGGKLINKIILKFTTSSPTEGTFSLMFSDTGSTTESYESWHPIISDISNKLKLPLIKSYPLLDALNASAAGTATSDDIAVLQHYLTPLGIGGI